MEYEQFVSTLRRVTRTAPRAERLAFRVIEEHLPVNVVVHREVAERVPGGNKQLVRRVTERLEAAELLDIVQSSTNCCRPGQGLHWRWRS